MNLNEYLDRNNLNIKQFSKKAGISSRTIDYFLDGQSTQKLDTIYRIYIASECTLDISEPLRKICVKLWKKSEKIKQRLLKKNCEI